LTWLVPQFSQHILKTGASANIQNILILLEMELRQMGEIDKQSFLGGGSFASFPEDDPQSNYS